MSKYVTITLSLCDRILYKIEYTVSLPLENHFLNCKNEKERS